MNRRHFLSLAGAAGLSAVAPSSLAAIKEAKTPIKQSEDFTFLFITDTHIQPELNATEGCDQCFRKARLIKSDFVIQGGDHVIDALGVSKAKALSLFDLYGKTEQDLGVKIHHTIGNHDCFGVFPSSGVGEADPLYGKKLFEERFGKTYYSFNHKGVHFIVLDSIGITDDHGYEGRIDSDQLQWLKADLSGLEHGTPIIVSTHMPLATAFNSYVPPMSTPPKHPTLSVGNAYEVIQLLEKQNVLGVLQGHTHINEQIIWNGIPFISSGAVCGNWWQGTRMGTPEGFTVVTLSGGKLSTRYETYGFKSIAPKNT